MYTRFQILLSKRALSPTYKALFCKKKWLKIGILRTEVAAQLAIRKLIHSECKKPLSFTSFKLFKLILHILISVPNAFCSRLIFKNLDFFKFCTKFPSHAYVTAFSFILRKHWFEQFGILEVLSWMCSKPRTILLELKNLFCILESSIFYSFIEERY